MSSADIDELHRRQLLPEPENAFALCVIFFMVIAYIGSTFA